MPAGAKKPKGKPRGGSRKGIPNKATTQAREAIARLVDDNSARMQGWLDEIAETEGPLRAWQCLIDVIEYHIPKLARTEMTGADGKELPTHNITINAVSARD